MLSRHSEVARDVERDRQRMVGVVQRKRAIIYKGSP